MSKGSVCPGFKIVLQTKQVKKANCATDLKLDCKFLFDPLSQRAEADFMISDPRFSKQNQLRLAAKTIPNTDSNISMSIVNTEKQNLYTTAEVNCLQTEQPCIF